MAFTDRMKDLLDQGFSASKELASKAGAKAQELGEIGVLKLEIAQLEGQAQKLIVRLGSETYKALVEQGVESITAGTLAIRSLLTEITSIRDSIEKREADIRAKRS